jgi:magnesium-protoporphyrin IX monomethyl ester (oxidative) cyclase
LKAHFFPPPLPLETRAFLREKMAVEMALVKPLSKFSSTPKFGNPRSFSYPKFITIKMSATAKTTSSPKPRKKGNKGEIKETLLAPRFYTTDFDEMETLFNTEINKNLNQSEFEALLQEFKTDYNQTHFVRNKEFKEAADKMQGPLRQIFVEFLERSCTAEFSGFLLYKELGRRLKVRLYSHSNFMHNLIPCFPV